MRLCDSRGRLATEEGASNDPYNIATELLNCAPHEKRNFVFLVLSQEIQEALASFQFRVGGKLTSQLRVGREDEGGMLMQCPQNC